MARPVIGRSLFGAEKADRTSTYIIFAHAERRNEIANSSITLEVLNDPEELGGRAAECRQPRPHVAELTDRRLRLSGRCARIPQLARRAGRLAQVRRPFRPVAPHGRSLYQRQGLREAAGRHDDQHLQEFRGESRQAICPDHPLWPCDRRRHHFPFGGRGMRLCRPRARRELADVPRRDRRLRRRGDQGRPLAVAPDGQAGEAHLLALPDPGPERLADHREAERRPGREAEILPYELDQHRRPQGPHPSSRHGRRAGPGALGPLRGDRGNPRRHSRGRQGIRHRSRRLARLSVEHAGVRAGSRRRCRRSIPATS